MREATPAAVTEALVETMPYLPGGKDKAAMLDDAMRAKLLAAMPGLKERAKTLVELLDGAGYLFAVRPLATDEKAAAVLDNGGRDHLRQLQPRLSGLAEWSAQSTEGAVRAYAEEAGLKLGQMAQPLRAALTGRTTSPGIFDVLDVLGREESLGRIADAIG